jgi:hypothetical protein
MTTSLLMRLGRAGIAAAGLALVATVSPGLPTGSAWGSSTESQLAQVRQATAQYHDVDTAEGDGFVPFLDCFDSPEGGMGQHFLLPKALDGSVNLTNPPVLVYEQFKDGYKLAAVEYVVPGPADMTPPTLLGRSFTYNSSLGVWKLHAWIWKNNPSGMFADWNPKVSACHA